MSDTPRWDNLPVPSSDPSGGGGDWSGFTADPRVNPGLRASDADRSRASSIVSAAYADGRLNRDEFDQRINQAASARELGELVPVLTDLVAVRPAASSGPPGAAASPAAAPLPVTGGFGVRGLLGRMPSWWLGLAFMFNAIWLMTVLTSGHLIYYWPMWPMLGTAVPAVIAMTSGRSVGQRRAARDEFRAQRRAFRRGEVPPQQLPPGDELR